MTDQARPQTTDSVPIAGGSVAGRAYREELARQGQLLEPLAVPQAEVQKSSPMAQGTAVDARAATRKKVNGRARVMLARGESVVGKMVDLSLTGACVMMDGMIPSRIACTVDFDIFHEGKRHQFSVPAVTVYGVLASGSGFKVGFQFGPCNPGAKKVLTELVA